MKHNVFIARFVPPLLFIALIFAIANRWGKLPALGPLLFPHSGIWNMPEVVKLTSIEMRTPGIQSEVEVIWDENRVPHIRAANESDLAFVEGYVHASQRLFQMDIQTRAGSGRLSELVGARTSQMDLQYRQMGLHRVAEKSLELMLKDPELKIILQSYANGVNFFIDGLNSSNMPTEYRFLNLQPKRWTPLQTAEFLTLMIYRLSGRSFDLPLTVLAKKIGLSTVRELFPEFLDGEHEAPFILHPKINSRQFNLDAPATNDFLSDFSELPELLQPFRSNGSNSWGVSQKKNVKGHVMIANDTHLGFSAPGIWFEQQLLTPAQNVYGGGFAGSPGVMSGFTNETAWAVTNATTDVMDWYQIEFKDENSLSYKFGDEWLKAEVDEQTINVYGENPIKATVLWTRFGPVVARHGAKGLSLKWTAHDGSLALKSFLALNRSRSHDECRKIVSQFDSPNQNFICADAEHLSLTHAGRVPRRWRGQGQLILNGSDKTHFWGDVTNSGEYLFDSNEDFVSSANQRPVAKTTDLYLGLESENAWRGKRIQKLLGHEGAKKFSIDDFKKFQQDEFNPLASEVLPIFLSQLKNVREEQKNIIDSLSKWNYQDVLDSEAAGFFFDWWSTFQRDQWQSKLGLAKQSVWPRDQFLVQLIKNSNSPVSKKWILNLGELVNDSFQETWHLFATENSADSKKMKLGAVRQMIFPHVARFPGIEIRVNSGGGRQSLNAMQTNHGPTWRMVVELGGEPMGFTSVPGSSAGDPLSIEFERGYKEWGSGEYKTAKFYTENNWREKLETAPQVWRFVKDFKQ